MASTLTLIILMFSFGFICGKRYERSSALLKAGEQTSSGTSARAE